MSHNVVIDLTSDDENEETPKVLPHKDIVTTPNKDLKSYFPTKPNSLQDTPNARKRLEIDELGSNKKVNILAVRRKPGSSHHEESPQTKGSLNCNESSTESHECCQGQTLNVASSFTAAESEAATRTIIRTQIKEKLTRIKNAAFRMDDEEWKDNDRSTKNIIKKNISSMDLLDQYFPSSGDLKAARAMLGIMDVDDHSIQMIEKESMELCKNLTIPSLPLTEDAEKLDLDLDQRLRSIANVVDSSKALRALGIDQDLEEKNPDNRVQLEEEEEEEEAPIHENDDECYVCGEGGLLYLCDRCPKSFHADCMDDEPPSKEDGDDSESEEFICPMCLGEDFIDDDSDEEINVRKTLELFSSFKQAREARVNEMKARKSIITADAAEEHETAVEDRHTKAIRSLVWTMDEEYETVTREIERGGKFAEVQQLKGREALLIESMVKKQRELEEAKRLGNLRRKSSPEPDDQTNTREIKKKQKNNKKARRDSFSTNSSSSADSEDNEYQLHFDPENDVISE